jgi:hypothetical protein
MKTLCIHTKRLVGLVAATAALALVAGPSALAASGQVAPDHRAASDQFASLENDLSLLRDRSTDRGTFVPEIDASLLRDRSTDSVLIQSAPDHQSAINGLHGTDSSLLRDRSTDRGGSASAAPVPTSQPVADDGLRWADAGVAAGSVFGLMLMALLATVVVRRNRQEPKGA